ncbi:hypothetical protein BU15DRAFT_83501 [Melanogaster broomeanus]|nr:hypothetical protein BU15DRAFT_83501 [Melanogaster broomeanus]
MITDPSDQPNDLSTAIQTTSPHLSLGPTNTFGSPIPWPTQRLWVTDPSAHPTPMDPSAHPTPLAHLSLGPPNAFGSHPSAHPTPSDHLSLGPPNTFGSPIPGPTQHL